MQPPVIFDAYHTTMIALDYSVEHEADIPASDVETVVIANFPLAQYDRGSCLPN
jgi:hypothetical protein